VAAGYGTWQDRYQYTMPHAPATLSSDFISTCHLKFIKFTYYSLILVPKPCFLKITVLYFAIVIKIRQV
jgi:hypothetical protein